MRKGTETVAAELWSHCHRGRVRGDRASAGLAGTQGVPGQQRVSPALRNPGRDTIRAAQRLLAANPNRPEDRIRQDIGRLLDSLEIDNLLTFRTRAGPADIFLPNRRVFIETKAAGLADDPHRAQTRENPETPFQQLERYLTAEMGDELGRLPLDDQPDLPWTGVVTDGRVWHAWRFPHSHPTTHELVLDGFRPQTGDELVLRIGPILNVEPVGKPWIPSDPVPLFVGALDDLREVHAGLTRERVRQTTETKMRLWLDMLRGSGMAPETDDARTRLFTAHCFLVALARGVVHTLVNPNIRPDTAELLGSGFLAWIVEVEDGRVWARELLDRVHTYEWRRTAGDVLRPLYERFVDRGDRRDFGEVYTPDWLAEMMVGEVLDEEWCNQAVTAALTELRGRGRTDGIGVLDPTCGSGTFLFHCAKRILASELAEGLQPGQQADVVCRLVHGIDIHPVAVEFSRATLLRALPATPSAANMALAIYQGDALMLRQTDRHTLFEPRNGEILIRTPYGHEIVLPRAFTEHADFPDMLRRMVDTAAHGAALPADVGLVAEDEEDRAMVAACHMALTEVIEREGNSVWTWYITNVLGPDRLARRKVNRIVANPPWVKLAKIQVPERKRALERIAGKDEQAGHLDLWTGGRQAPHFDIAQLFIRHARGAYLNEPNSDPSAWVTKAAAIRAGNWQKFRDWHANFLAQALDLSDARVFGGGDARRSCVLFEIRRSSLTPSGDDGGRVLKAECPGATPDASASLDEAHTLLCLTTPRRFPQAPSDYAADTWRQGATVVPKVLTLTATVGAGTRSDTRIATTVRSDQRPWDTVQPRSGEVPAHWLTPMLTSKQLLPFGLGSAGPETAIIPRSEDGELLSTETARRTVFWAELDDLYRERRGIGGNTPQTLMSRMDYGRALSVQLPLRSRRSRLVAYPTSGDVMRAARIQEGMAVMDSNVYWRTMESVTEAQYLVAVLNAPTLEEAFRACRTSGRHFHKNPWRAMPIPAWDAGDRTHRRLAALALRAERTIGAMDLPAGQVAASRRIRTRLAEDGTFAELDALVREILPNHAT